LIELAQNKELLKQSCKENENIICPRNIYRFGNRIVVEYEHETIVIPIKRKLTYEQWAEKRDKRIMKTFRKLRKLEQEYQRQREYVKNLRQQFYRLKQEYIELKKQYETLKIPTLEQLLSEKNMELIRFRGKYHTERTRMRVIRGQIKAIKQKFERSRRIAKMQFEGYKPMHSLPVSQWKSRIKSALDMLNAYLEKGDWNGYTITRKLNHRDIEVVTDWHQFLNDLLYELTHDYLIDVFEFGKEFKKPILVKMLQNELYSFSFDSVMKSVALWLKTKP
jgi:predicted RNase H-like nuclease (RuvC/YqgF family)